MCSGSLNEFRQNPQEYSINVEMYMKVVDVDIWVIGAAENLDRLLCVPDTGSHSCLSILFRSLVWKEIELDAAAY